jgi:hypothetical protein
VKSDAVRDPPRRAINSSISNQRRFELPAGQRHPGATRDAGRQPRISLSSHQRSTVGTTTIEPIAQVIIAHNETYASKLPNETHK